MSSKVIVEPPIHRLQPDEPLNRDAFSKKVPIVAVKIPASRTTELRSSPVLKRSLLQLPRVKVAIQVPNESDKRMLLLDAPREDTVTDDLQQFVQTNGLELVPYALELDYDYWTYDQILRSTLPESLLEDMPTAFTITGHLAHLNLRDDYLPYKNIIGQIILDKNKGLRTVVNKTDNIDTQFRFFKMEVLAGESDTLVETSESGCRFKFDFAKVYWNSRLGTEHERLVSLIQPGELVVDVFAGVGPFAIPAARKGCLVFANDLNPSSTEYLAQNCKANNVQDRIRVTTKDGREFIQFAILEAIKNPFTDVRPLQSARQRAKEARQGRQAPQPSSEPAQRAIKHFIMNLPATAIEFLDAFRQFSESADQLRGFYGPDAMPMIHCYCFTRELEQPQAEVDILKRAEDALGVPIPNPSFHCVRRVAPNKDMYCLSFSLPSTMIT